MKSSANIVLNTHKTSRDGTHAVSLEIIKDGKRLTLKSLKIKCSKDDWNFKKKELKKSHPNHVNGNQYIKDKKKEAEDILFRFERENINFTTDTFLTEILGVDKNTKSFFEFFKTRIDEFTKANSRTGETYDDTMKSFKKFHNKPNMIFSELNYELLKKYETFLRGRGCIGGGISVRMRTLRALYNEAIKRGIALSKEYPFEQYKMSELKETKLKVRLTLKEMDAFKEFDIAKYPEYELFHKYFLFSYYARGINYTDMMKLKWSDVSEEHFYYQRSKTKRNIEVQINSKLKEILNYFEQNKNGSGYVFPILRKDGLDAIQIENRRKKVLGQYNRALKEIGEILLLNKSLSSNVARHSYATNLREKGFSTGQIKQGMGHSKESYTENYLNNFPKQEIDEMTNSLI